MCGIVGYIGPKSIESVLLVGLQKLEYRGYDSAGMAVLNGDELATRKAVGKIIELEKQLKNQPILGTAGIAHTRWATHGEPSENNAHPHVSNDKTVVGVHNGIIENYQDVKNKLLRHNYHFYSDTDTEVVIKLVDYYYKKYNLGPIDAIAKTMV